LIKTQNLLLQSFLTEKLTDLRLLILGTRRW